MIVPVTVLANLNGSGDRRGTQVDTIIIHTTEGTAASALAWFQKPEARVAAHYVVSPDGRIYSCVGEGRAAWHAGNFKYNLRSVGIEVAGHAADPGTWTAPAVEAIVQLLVDLCRRYPAIQPSRSSIIGHAEVPDPVNPYKFGGAGGHTDPGLHVPWEYLIGETQRRLAPPVAPEIA